VRQIPIIVLFTYLVTYNKNNCYFTHLPNSCVVLDVATPPDFIELITFSAIGPLLFAKPR
jgi:hypothetical protein